MTGVFVTGTDTGIGKTMVACALVAALRARGRAVGVYKPAETGCTEKDGRLVGADASRLVAAAGGSQDPESAASYLFALPAAPLVAAEAAGQAIDPRKLAADFARVASAREVVIVEGAGGLLVPIAERHTYLDLVRELRLSVVCVIGSRLGCINHALLTLGALESAGAATAGFVLNQLEAGDDARRFAESNRATIRRFARARDLGLFPYVPEGMRDDYAELASLAARNLDLDAIA